MGALIGKLLNILWKPNKASSAVAPAVLLTPEKISERLQHHAAFRHESQHTNQSRSTLPSKSDQSEGPIEIESVSRDTSDHIAQHPEEWRPSAEGLDAARPVESVGADTVGILIASSEPASVPTVLTEAFADAGTAEVSAAAEQAIRHQDWQIPTHHNEPAAEILAEFDAFIRDRSSEKSASTVDASKDVLKILRLDPDEVIKAVTPLVDTASVSIPVRNEPEADSTVSLEQKEGIEARFCTTQEEISNAYINLSVGDVITGQGCSVRLSNCITANPDFFSRWTIADALVSRDAFLSELMHLRNLGRKTADEALDALDAYVSEHEVERDEAPIVDPFFGLIPAELDVPIGDVIRSHHVSVRLANVAMSGGLDGLTVRNLITDPDNVRARLIGCKNVGQKTIAEAMDLLAAHVEALGSPEVEHEASARADDLLPEGITTGERIRQELGSLPSKHVEVLHSRYGLDGGVPQTLQEIAERVHVTRERVRQVEAKALKRLRVERRSRAAFERHLAEGRDIQWTTLFSVDSSLPEDEVAERFRKLDPWFLLAVDILFEDGIKGYLTANAHRTTNGWFRNAAEADQRHAVDQIVRELLSVHPTPMPLDTLEEIAPNIEATKLVSGQHWVVHDGYLFSGQPSSKSIRTARMHAIARTIAVSGVFDIRTLIAVYRSRFPSEDCGSRLFDREASDASHLFAPIFDGVWLCLDHESRHLCTIPSPPFERGLIEEKHFAEGSIGSLLIRRLGELGPQRLIDLRKTITESGQGAISESSVGAILISNPCFRRVAPGVFGILDGEVEAHSILDTYLLEERHCRFFCNARRSGAPLGYYPAWDAAFEMRLSSWASRQASPELYRSLMAIIEPDLWPAPPEIVSEFRARQQQDGHWEIGAPRRLALGHRFLDAGQFLSVLAHLVVFGWISWVGANRATGSKIDNHDAADVLALFVMTGLVEPQADWQAPHRPTALAKCLFLEARWERHLHGGNTGDDSAFKRLQTALYRSPTNSSRGWVDAEEFTGAMQAWRSDGIWMGKAYGGAQPRQIGLAEDNLFESDDWSAAFSS